MTLPPSPPPPLMARHPPAPHAPDQPTIRDILETADQIGVLGDLSGYEEHTRVESAHDERARRRLLMHTRRSSYDMPRRVLVLVVSGMQQARAGDSAIATLTPTPTVPPHPNP